MKVEVNEKEKGFQPIKLKITIESEQELCSLWHRMNVSVSNVNDYSGDILKYKSTDKDVCLFNKLNQLVKTNNLKK